MCQSYTGTIWIFSNCTQGRFNWAGKTGITQHVEIRVFVLPHRRWIDAKIARYVGFVNREARLSNQRLGGFGTYYDRV